MRMGLVDMRRGMLCSPPLLLLRSVGMLSFSGAAEGIGGRVPTDAAGATAASTAGVTAAKDAIGEMAAVVSAGAGGVATAASDCM